MVKKIRLPRLTKRDLERILDVHQQLNRVKDSLDRTSWTGGRACAGGIMASLELPAAPAEVTAVVTEPDYNPKG